MKIIFLSHELIVSRPRIIKSLWDYSYSVIVSVYSVSLFYSCLKKAMESPALSLRIYQTILCRTSINGRSIFSSLKRSATETLWNTFFINYWSNLNWWKNLRFNLTFYFSTFLKVTHVFHRKSKLYTTFADFGINVASLLRQASTRLQQTQ